LKEQESSTLNYIFSDQDSYALIEAVDPDWEGALPYTLIVKPGGEVLYRHMGAIDPLEVKRAIVGYLGRTY
ncbi:MAG: redoxin, partial [Candidatus Hydrogenedentes bacterium]|nr:redoxin [Candidatus Hydrogenedentota bacterium]